MDKAKWPGVWMMTDERMGEALWPALAALPNGAGVVFRHHAHADRGDLARRVAEIAEARGLTLVVSRDLALAREIGAAMVHNPAGATGGMPFSMAVHSLEEARDANRRGAALAFVSPIFATRSHPGAGALPRAEVAAIVQALDCPAIALGGVDARNYATLGGLGFSGWAGIDAWLRT